MKSSLKWIIPIAATVILALGGLVYASIDGRIKRNEFSLDTVIPILYEIRAQSRQNGENIRRLLERQEDDLTD